MRDFSGHLWCAVTVLIWGLTFVSTKVLLTSLSPFEILFDRSLIALISLLLLTRALPHFFSLNYTVYCMLAALCGNVLYFIFENNALSFSYASNVSVIVATAPLFTALLDNLLQKRRLFSLHFLIGFLFAMTGTVCLLWSSIELKLNPRGDLLALLSALSWACYTIFVKRLVLLGYHIQQLTVSIFTLSLLLQLPLLPLYGYELKLEALSTLSVGGNLLFLGVLASALCYMFWNKAVKLIGPVKTSVYLYAQPVVTALAASVLIHERPTGLTCLGIVLVILGLVVSELELWRVVARRRI